jgi:hypothetical protein
MRRWFAAVALGAAACLVFGAGAAVADPDDGPAVPKLPRELKTFSVSGPSGVWDFRDVDLGTGITECPQARMNVEPDELAQRDKDAV